MKKILVVIHDMASGGGQKSLLSFLRCLDHAGKTSEYDIDLMVAKPEGIFMDQIPKTVHIVETPKTLLWLATPSGNPMLKENFSVKGFAGKMRSTIKKKLGLDKKNLNDEQILWSNWKRFIPENPTKYDVAISYINGFPNYYVIDKVCADKKVLWIHNEYQKLGYDVTYDAPYYNKADEIITISQICVDSFCEKFPKMKEKVHILENITMKEDILKKGNEDSADEFEGADIKILSVGRLCEQKGFDFSIDAARKLKKMGYHFRWLILGEGPDRQQLQAKIDEYQLEDEFQMIGIRSNPYAYINACDVFVQSSRFEGKSIVLDEAKIFCKPIVVSNYPTVYDSIRNEENGLIVEMNGEGVADGISRLVSDNELQQKLIANLSSNNDSNESELRKYMEIMF